MTRRLWLMPTMALALLLAACGDDAEPQGSAEVVAPEETTADGDDTDAGDGDAPEDDDTDDDGDSTGDDATDDTTDPDDTTDGGDTENGDDDDDGETPAPTEPVAVDVETALDVDPSESWLINPHFETEVGGGEGIPVFTVQASNLTLHAQPLVEAAEVGTLPYAVGDEVPYLATRTLNHGHGVLRPTGPVELTLRDLGDESFLREDAYRDLDADLVTLPLSGDSLVLVLSYGPEGSCFVAIAGPADDDYQGLPNAPEGVTGFPGSVFDAFECPGGPDYESLAEPVLRDWLLVPDADGEPLGWVEAGPGLIEVTDVLF